MKKPLLLIMGLALIGAACHQSPTPRPNLSPKPALSSSPEAGLRELKAPLYMGYFRSWHDRYSWEPDHSAHQMSDVPKDVDILFLFHDWTEPTSPFWKQLKDVYIPKLNKQGTWVVRTVGIKDIDGQRSVSKDFSYTKDAAGWKKLAEQLVTEYVDKYDLNGLDIDFEHHDGPYTEPARKAQIIAVVKELAEILHKNKKLLILDTNKGAEDEDGIFIATKDCWDYVLQQNYGNNRYTNTYFSDYAQHISKEKLLTGFSFYEENGNQWHDVPDISLVADDKTNTPKPSITVDSLLANQDFKSCRAYQMALWTAQNGYGGCFSYAIERDGVRHGNDQKFFDYTKDGCPSQYLFSKALKKIMVDTYKQ